MPQKGAPVKIPLIVDLHIEEFVAGVVQSFESGAVNVVYDQYKDGRWYVTQRPGMNQLEDASATISDARGRGVYYWDQANNRYIINANKIYQGSYSGTAATITTGTQRVEMFDVGDFLVAIDPENNQGWTAPSGSPTTFTEIDDLAFPPKQTPSLQLARGGAVLNGKLYVMATNGEIWESDVELPRVWNLLSFRTAEIEPDKGVYLTKHHQHVVAFGTRTIEFFDDTANPTGSTLTPRSDVTYDVGAVDADTMARIGDRLYFVGQDSTGSVGVYMLDNFALQKVSGETLDTFLTSAVTADMMGLVGSGFVAGGRDFYMLTLYNTPADIDPVETLTYVSTRGWWGFWELQLPDVTHCPIVAWMQSTTTRAGEGILTNGDVVNVTDDFCPFDTVGAGAVYEADVYEADVYTATGATGTVIPWEITAGEYDGGTPLIKKQGDLWLMHTPMAVDETVTIATADDGAAFGAGRSLSIKDKDARLNRMGSFRQRNYKLSGSLTEQMYLEYIHTTARAG